MANRQNLKSMIGDVLDAGVNVKAREVERHMETMAPAPVASRVLKLPLDRVQPDPDQPRRTFNDDSLEELAASIREQGVLEPVQVIAIEDGYQLLHGERRWRASHLAGLTWIPAIIYEDQISDADRLTRQLIENIQREDLNDVDRAAALERLKDLVGATWEEVASKVGLTVGRIHQLRRLSRLAPELQDAVKAGDLTEKDTRPFQGLTADQQIALYRTGQDEELSPDVVKKVAQMLKKEADVDVGEAIKQDEIEQSVAHQQTEDLRTWEPENLRPGGSESPPWTGEPTNFALPPENLDHDRPFERGLVTDAPVMAPIQDLNDPELTAPEVSEEPATSIQEDHRPYDDVGTEHLLAHMDHIVGDFSRQLNLLIDALRRRPLASWEQERIDEAFKLLQGVLIQLQPDVPEEAIDLAPADAEPTV